MRPLFASALALLAVVSLPAQEVVFDPAWSQDALWDDGLCEVAHFDAVTFSEGREWQHMATAITCAEMFSDVFHARADAPDDSDIAVIKSNLVFAAPTGPCETRVMSSVFVRRDAPQTLVKEVVTTQDWRGTSLFEVRGWTDPLSLVWHTHWDGEGDGERALDSAGPAMTLEQLLVSCRSLRCHEEPHFEVQLLDPLLRSRLGETTLHPAAVEVQPYVAAIESPFGQEAWCVRVRPQGGAEVTLWYRPAPPHPLLLLEAPEAQVGLRRLELREISRERPW